MEAAVAAAAGEFPEVAVDFPEASEEVAGVGWVHGEIGRARKLANELDLGNVITIPGWIGPAERDSLFKELKLRHYSDERYQCHECGIKPSSSVDLMHCSACMSVWYCSKKCHRRSWRSGHKAVCPLLKASDDSNLLHIIIGKGMTRKILDEGFLLLRNDEQGNESHKSEPVIIVKDHNTGEYFDSVHDHGVEFVETLAEAMQLKKSYYGHTGLEIIFHGFDEEYACM